LTGEQNPEENAMKKQPSSVPTFGVYENPRNSSIVLVIAAMFLGLFVPSSVVAQDKPLFWTSGGNWGRWLKISNYPEVAVRTACGDDSTLNNHPVSSEDWQLQNNYRAPMVVIWRVQFFNQNHGRNEMSGWMLEHLKAGEVSNGWMVTAGHCKAWNTLTVQVKCAIPDTGENAGAACFKDSHGNPIAERTDQFRERPPQPALSATTGAQPAKDLSQIDSSIWNCSGDIDDFYGGESIVRGPWVIQFLPDRTFTNKSATDPSIWAIFVDEHWIQNGNQVSWSQKASELNFSGNYKGNSMMLTVAGTDPRTHGTLDCTRSPESVPSVRYWYCQVSNPYPIRSVMSKVYARSTSTSYETVQKEFDDWQKPRSERPDFYGGAICSSFLSLQEANASHDSLGNWGDPVGAPPDPQQPDTTQVDQKSSGLPTVLVRRGPSLRSFSVGEGEGTAIAAKVATAMGGLAKLKSIKTMRGNIVESDSGGPASAVDVSIAFPDSMHVEMQTAQGKLTIVTSPVVAFMSMAGMGTRNLLPAENKELLSQLHHDLVYVAQHVDDPSFTFTAAGTEKVGNIDAAVLDIGGAIPWVRWYIDPKTGYMLREQYKGMGQSGPFDGESNLSDWRTIDGLTMPYQHQNKQNGEATGTAELKKIEINPQFDPKLFENSTIGQATSLNSRDHSHTPGSRL
jgi:hypothetical protein